MTKITIVDDDVEFSENLSRILQQAGYEVTVKNHTDGLLQALARDKPDLLILDVMFPDNPVAGFDTARAVRLKKETKNIPIILLTAVNQVHPMDFAACDIDSEWMPVQDFAEKPLAKAAILKKISKLLQVKAKKHS
ncbi:MAG: response regulator [bacterium]